MKASGQRPKPMAGRYQARARAMSSARVGSRPGRLRRGLMRALWRKRLKVGGGVGEVDAEEAPEAGIAEGLPVIAVQIIAGEDSRAAGAVGELEGDGFGSADLDAAEHDATGAAGLLGPA